MAVLLWSLAFLCSIWKNVYFYGLLLLMISLSDSKSYYRLALIILFHIYII